MARPVVDSIHPLMRHNLLSAANTSRVVAAATAGVASESMLHRAPGLPADPHHPSSPYCCATSPGIVSQRPATGRDDEMFPFYTWLLSRHGAFLNHRIHPAGKHTHQTMFVGPNPTHDCTDPTQVNPLLK